MNKIDIDIETLISLIEKRPVLWDKTLPNYDKLKFKHSAWEFVCRRLNTSFLNMDDRKRRAFINSVKVKWRRLRNSFLSHKKDLNNSGSFAKSYLIYADKMKFLEKICDSTPDLSQTYFSDEDNFTLNFHSEDSFNDELLKDNFKPSSPKKLKNRSDFVTPKNSKEPTTLSTSFTTFFQEIAPHLNKFNTSEFIEFQAGFLKVIASIYEKRKQNLSAIPRL